MAGIGNGSVAELRKFQQQFQTRFETYTDPSLESFRQFGMQKKFGIGPRAIVRYLKVLAAGHRQGWTQGDPWQQGGVVIVDQGMTVLWKHVNNGPGDHADLGQIIEQVTGRN